MAKLNLKATNIKNLFCTRSMKSISVLVYGFQVGAPYSRIDLTNAQYRSLNDLSSLNSEEWRLINPKISIYL